MPCESNLVGSPKDAQWQSLQTSPLVGRTWSLAFHLWRSFNKFSVSLVAQLVKNSPAMQETWFDFWVGKMPWRMDRLPIPVSLGFPCGSAGKESPCNVGDLDLIPELGRGSGEGKGYPLQYSGLENSMDYTVHGVAKSWIRLSDFHFFTTGPPGKFVSVSFW